MSAQVVQLIVVLAPLLLILALFLAMPRPPRVSLTVADGDLTIRLHGLDKLFCCRRTVVVPTEDVEGVCVSRRDLVPAEGLRLPGTGVPGVIRAGSFGKGDARDFWDVRRAETVLVIQLRPGAEFRRIVLELREPREEALRLRPMLGATTLPLMTP